MACFADMNVSQGGVATYARFAGIFNIHLNANLLRNLPVFFKSVMIRQNYGHESVAPVFLADPVYILGNAAGLTLILAVRAAVRA